jgi:hypothetical protein
MNATSHLYSMSECSNCTNSIANTNSNIDDSGQGCMMLKYKMHQKAQLKGKGGISSISNNISYSNSGCNGSNAHIKLTPLKYNNMYGKVNSQRNKQCNAISRFNLCSDNSNTSGSKENKVGGHFRLLTLQNPISKEKVVSPFYDNMFSSTCSGRNKYYNEKAILKEIQISTEINNKLLSLSKRNNNSNSCKSNSPYSKLDFMAFDKYIENNLQSRNYQRKLQQQSNISTKYKTNLYNKSAIFVKVKKASGIPTIYDINMNNNL